MKTWLREHAGTVGAACAVAGLCAFAAAGRSRFLLASPYPLGVDGYFYPVQLRSLLETGRLYYPTSPLVFWLMAPLAWLTDPIVGAKLGAAAGTALMVVPAYLVARRVSGDRAAAILGATLVATSAESFYLSTEFVKEGVGLSLAVGAVAALAAALARPGRARIALAAALFAAALLAHKSAAGLALVLAAPPLCARVGRRRALLAVGAAAGAVVLLGLALPHQFVGARDLGLALRLVRARADLGLPVLAVPGYPALAFQHEVAVAAGLALLVLGLHAARRVLPRAPAAAAPTLPSLAVGFLAFALFLGLPWLDVSDRQGLAFRLRLTAFVTLAPLAALAFVRLAAAARAPAYARAMMALGAALGLLLSRPVGSPEGLVDPHPALVAAVRALDGVVPPGATVVTPERHVAFMAAWYARVPARLRPPPDADPRRTFRLLTGHFIRERSALWQALDDLRAHPRPDVAPTRDLHPVHANGLTLVPELTWRHLLAGLPEPARARWADWPTQ